MPQVGININRGEPITLDALDEFTPWADVTPHEAGLVTILLQFSGTWNGTVRFDGGVKVSGTVVADPIQATNLNTGTAATTSTGGASVTEIWRVDASALDGVRVYVSAFVAGSVNVTYNWARG